MRQAYQNITGSSAGVAATHQYVRFKPTTGQINVLEEDLELFDAPLDHQIISEGDYYQDPAVPMEEVTWLHTVVPAGFTFPAGIACQNLATIHIPANLAVEAEAERLAGLNADGDGPGGVAFKAPVPGGNPQICGPRECWVCPPDFACACEPCGSPPPPPVAPRPRIMLDDTQFAANQGLRKARVVIKRWFKIDRVFTDGNGNFVLTKNFRKKVKINVKFKNAEARIYGVRGIRLWQMLQVIKFRGGLFDVNNINRPIITFTRNNTVNSKGNRYWVAATTHNAVQEMRAFATRQNIGLPPDRLMIYLGNWGDFGSRGSGSAPMFAQRNTVALTQSFLQTHLYSEPRFGQGFLNFVSQVLTKGMDITYNYNVGDINRLASDDVCETIYHELCHAAHYNKLGEDWYGTFVNSEVAEIANTLLNRDLRPYGGGNNPNHSPIIALGEGWAYHMGRVIADQRYGTQSSEQATQARGFRIGNVGGTRAHIGALENFNPNLADDAHRWIPKGLMLDLNDANNETRPPNFVTDRVNGYTNAQFFNALDSDIRSVPAFRDRLLQENNNSQQPQVNALFREYNY